MIKTIYICDKCGSQHPTPDQFWSIGVWAAPNAGNYGSYAHQHAKSIQVCRACLENLGVHVQKVTAATPAYVERTTEDILRELIERIQT